MKARGGKSRVAGDAAGFSIILEPLGFLSDLVTDTGRDLGQIGFCLFFSGPLFAHL